MLNNDAMRVLLFQTARSCHIVMCGAARGGVRECKNKRSVRANDEK